jgi:hypothetical protein
MKDKKEVIRHKGNFSALAMKQSHYIDKYKPLIKQVRTVFKNG